MLRFAEPKRFMELSAKAMPWLAGLTISSAIAGLYLGLLDSPPDYQQGDSVRIMYLHVPAAWMALFCYLCLAAASAVSLIWRHPLADPVAKGTAIIGACFTFLALLTGALWGKPMWGDWWVWDARLTSVLILFFLYLGYIALDGAFDDPARGAKAASILALVGVVNVPIIHFSVVWWNTLHQPASVVKAGGPSIHPSMLAPLLLMVLTFTIYYLWVLMLRVRGEIVARGIRGVRIRQTRG